MVAASQSVVPHAQLAGLTAVPSVVAQGAKELHELNEDVQKSPVVSASQVAVPQAQAASLAAVPSVLAQATKPHRLSPAKQTRVVPGVQSTEPQAQVAALGEVPSVLAHEEQRLALIWGGLSLAVLSTQACPQSVWEKAVAKLNTRRRRGRRRPV